MVTDQCRGWYLSTGAAEVVNVDGDNQGLSWKELQVWGVEVFARGVGHTDVLKGVFRSTRARLEWRRT